jgi:hypothetical protein
MLQRELTPGMGSMLPRVFTPPLEHHINPPKGTLTAHAVGYGSGRDMSGGSGVRVYDPETECLCGCGLTPQTSWGFDANSFSKHVLGWKLLPYQQWLNIHALEKDDTDGGFRFKILVVLISRQQGKTYWLKQLGLWRLFVNARGNANRVTPGARLALIAAQNLQYAEGVLKDVVDEIRDSSSLSKELINHRVTNGNHRAILTNRRYWRAATASRKGGRSLSVDIAMLDELREHVTTDAWDAIAPTTLVRPFSQVVCTSNAGDVRSIVLRDLRDGAIRNIEAGDTQSTRTGLFEWSVPDNVDPRDETYWHMANPALGHLNNFKLSDLRSMFESMQYRNLPGFQTEHLCQWVDALKPGILPAEHWALTKDTASRRSLGATIYAGLDVNYERSRAFVSIAARRDDGNLHVEVVHAARGTDWIIPWLKQRKETWLTGIAVQKTGAPSSGMIEDLRRAGIPVVEWGPGIEVSGGSGMFFDQIVEHKIFHRPAPVLDRAAASGVSRNVGEGWVFDRRNSPVDVSPLIACVAAAWLANQPAANPPAVHSWPDDDTMREWEQEGAEKFKEGRPPNRSALDEIEGMSWWTR